MTKRAVIHVENTENLVEFAEFLATEGWTILSANKTEEILKRSGCWVLTDMKTYERALKKKVKVIKRTAFAESHMSGCSSGYPLHYFDKDWAEVFIEKVE